MSELVEALAPVAVLLPSSLPLLPSTAPDAATASAMATDMSSFATLDDSASSPPATCRSMAARSAVMSASVSEAIAASRSSALL